MNKITNYLVVLSLSIFSISTVYAGHGNGHGNGHAYGHGISHGNGMSHSGMVAKSKGQQVAKLSQKNRDQIKQFFTNNPHVVSPTSLPPGIEMNLARGKTLPPGIEKVYLPNELTSQLPQYPGYDYRVVGSDVMLVNSKTGVISDIISNVLK